MTNFVNICRAAIAPRRTRLTEHILNINELIYVN